MSEEAKDAGKAMILKMWGPEIAEAREKRTIDFNRLIEDLVSSFCFGEVWTRETLDSKTRSMITLPVLTALTKPNQIKAYIKGAIANGVSVDEIKEILIHSAVYAGVPRAKLGALAIMIGSDIDVVNV